MTLTPVAIIQHGKIVNTHHAAICHLDSYVDFNVCSHHWIVAIRNLIQ